MYTEIRLLVTKEMMYILGEKSNDAYGLLCQPHRIGSMAIAFANADLAYLKDLNQYKQIAEFYLGDAEFIYDSRKIQAIIMQLVKLLDLNVDAFWFFEIERFWLQKLDQELVRTVPRKEELSAKINDILSHLESLIQFQENLRDVLSELSLADRKASGHASSAQILRRLFRRFPTICNFCIGEGGYMLVDVDEHGEIRTEMLDRDMSNVFRAIFKPESSRLEYNDINDDKIICEYHVLSDVRMFIMYDLIEGLRRSICFARCATCKTFFFTSDKRLVYCPNPECSSVGSRMNRHKERISADPFLKEAFRYKIAMEARYQRTQDMINKKASNKTVSREEYDTWKNLFYESRKVYEKEKNEVILRCDSQEAINRVGEEFLARIRPRDYKPRGKKKKEAPPDTS